MSTNNESNGSIRSLIDFWGRAFSRTKKPPGAAISSLEEGEGEEVPVKEEKEGEVCLPSSSESLDSTEFLLSSTGPESSNVQQRGSVASTAESVEYFDSNGVDPATYFREVPSLRPSLDVHEAPPLLEDFYPPAHRPEPLQTQIEAQDTLEEEGDVHAPPLESPLAPSATGSFVALGAQLSDLESDDAGSCIQLGSGSGDASAGEGSFVLVNNPAKRESLNLSTDSFASDGSFVQVDIQRQCSDLPSDEASSFVKHDSERSQESSGTGTDEGSFVQVPESEPISPLNTPACDSDLLATLASALSLSRRSPPPTIAEENEDDDDELSEPPTEAALKRRSLESQGSSGSLVRTRLPGLDLAPLVITTTTSTASGAKETTPPPTLSARSVPSPSSYESPVSAPLDPAKLPDSKVRYRPTARRVRDNDYPVTYPPYQPPPESANSPTFPPPAEPRTRVSRLTTGGQSKSRQFLLQTLLQKARSSSSIASSEPAEEALSEVSSEVSGPASESEAGRHVRFREEVAAEVHPPAELEMSTEDQQLLFYSDAEADSFKLDYDAEMKIAASLNKSWYDWMLSEDDPPDEHKAAE